MTASNIHFNVIFSKIGENGVSPVDFTTSKSKPYRRNFDITGVPEYPLDAIKLAERSICT
jgi:hypothetical protein